MRGGTEFLIYVPYLCFYLVVCGEFARIPPLQTAESYGRATKLMLSAWVRVRNGLAWPPWAGPGAAAGGGAPAHTRLSHTIRRSEATHSPVGSHTFTHIKYHPWRVISIPRAVFISVFISCFLHKRHSPTHKRNSINVSFTSSQDSHCMCVYLCVLCQWQPFLCLLTYSAVDIPLHWRAIASDIGLRTKDTGHRTSGALYIGHWPSEKWNEKLPAIICSINRRFPPALHKGFSFNPSLDKALILFHFQTRTKSIGWLLLEVFTWVIILLYFF